MTRTRTVTILETELAEFARRTQKLRDINKGLFATAEALAKEIERLKAELEERERTIHARFVVIEGSSKDNTSIFDRGASEMYSVIAAELRNKNQLPTEQEALEILKARMEAK